MPTTPRAVLFDMDHTLIHNDCDVSWKSFMIELGRAPNDALATAQAYYDDYLAERLDIAQFMSWQLQEITTLTVADAEALARSHFENVVKPTIYPEALRRVREITQRKIPIAIVTSTNALAARPVAEYFGIDTLLATELETRDGRITGHFIPPYMTAQTKVLKAQEICKKWNIPLTETAYFGDSPADIPLLKVVGYPHAVNPKPELLNLAKKAGWPIHAFTPRITDNNTVRGHVSR